MSESDKNENSPPIVLPESSSNTGDLDSSAFNLPILSRSSLSGLLKNFGFNNTEKPIKEEETEEDQSEEENEISDTENSSDDMSSMKTPQIENFDGKNFSSWMAQMEAILFLNDLWVDLDSTIEDLEDARIRLKSKKAYYHIITRCDKDHVNFLESEAKGNSVKALKLLKAKYDRDSTINKVAELRNAMLMKFTQGPLNEHINAMQACYQKLKCHGLDLPQLLQAANLIISMPQEYDGVVGSFLRVKDDDLKFQDLAEALLDEEKRRNLMSYRPVENLAQASTSQTMPQRKSITCSFCKKKGHYSAICRLKAQKSTVSTERNSSNKRESSNNSSRNRANHSEYKEDDNKKAENDITENTMYSNVAFCGTSVAEKSNGGKRIKSIIVRVNNDLCENVAKNCEITTGCGSSVSPIRKRKITKLPPTPGNGIEDYLSDVSAAGSEYSISKISGDESPVLSINGSDELNKDLEMYQKCFSSGNSKRSNWILDSGASLHMSHEKLYFQNLELKPGGQIRIADGNFIEIKGFGTVKFMIKTKSDPIILFLKNVAYVPALHTNLMSVHCLTDDKFKISFDQDIALIQINNNFIDFAKFRENNYVVMEASCNQAMLCIDELHKRMAHRNIRDIKRLSNFGLDISKCSCSHQCDACMQSKSTDLSFPRKSEKPDKPLDVIVADVCGPMRVQSLGGKTYFLTLTDANSDYTEVKFLRNKCEAKIEIKNYIEFVKNQMSKKPKIFRSDRGGEFMDNELQTYFKNQGIRIELTTPDSPEQNGIAERKNRTLNDAVRTLLISSKLPNYLWAEAMNNVVYTFNRIIRKDKEASPIEIFFNKRAKGTFLEFGSQVYVNTKKHNRGKFDPRATVMRFLSVDDRSKGFRLWTGKTVVIDRNIRPKLNANLDYEDPITNIDLIKSSVKHQKQDTILPACQNDSSEPALRRSKRIADIKRANEFANISCSDNDPKSYKDATNRTDSHEWIKAMTEELDSLKETESYELTDLPPNKTAIGCKWVFKRKIEKGSTRYKARLVAQGFSQKYGEDYDEVFAPVARSPTIRLLLSMAGKRNLIIKQFDVKTAFLNGDLEEEIYMRQPTGFKTGDKVFRLRKSLYGLKQAARSWNTKLDKSLVKVGFKQSEADDCLYIKHVGKERIFIVCHVDDMIFAATNHKLIDQTFNQLSEDFALKDLGHVQEFLGVEIYKSRNGYSINQSKYISKIAAELNVANAKPQKYPIDPGYYALKSDELLPSNNEFRKIIGMLLYISTNTRPDIAASVCILAQRVEKPRSIDLSEALRIVKYLNGTKEHRLNLNCANKPQHLLAYSDANFAECKIEMKSNSGLICFVNGGPIVWRCRKQTNVALSTTEAEYYAITEAAKEVLWLQTLLNDFEAKVDDPTIILNDNQSTIAMLTNGDFMQRTKYIGVKYHFIRDWIRKGVIDVRYCPTEHNIADLLTKPLPGVRIEKLRTAAGLEKL